MFSHLARRALSAPISPFDQELRLRQVTKPAEHAHKRDFLVGLSVGQGLQPSGVAVLERLQPSVQGNTRSYACRHLRRWPSSATTYPKLLSHLGDMLSTAPLVGSDLIVEAGMSIRA